MTNDNQPPKSVEARINTILYRIYVKSDMTLGEASDAIMELLREARKEEAKLWNEHLATMQYDEYSTGVPQSEPNKWFVAWSNNRLAELSAGGTEGKQ